MTLDITRRMTLAGLGAFIASPSLLARTANAAAPRILVGVVEEDPPLFNPAVTSTISSFVAGSPVYSALTRLSYDGKITGDLAESWTISDDGKTYTFKLRKGITWHDGTPFSSADVAFSLGQINSKLHPYRGAMKSIAAFEAPDPDTFVLKLSAPQGSLIMTLGNFAGAILPKHIWDGKDPARDPHNKNPIGTGPFKFAEFTPGDQIRYVKNDKYFMKGLPGFDELVIRIMPDAASRIAAFQKGEIDMIYSSAVPATEVERIKKIPNTVLKFTQVSQAGYQGVLNLRNAPFSDVRVRQALAYAIDRTFIRESVFPGLADNMVGPIPPAHPLANKALKDYPLDPAKAMALLDEAGFKPGADGVRFPMRYVFATNDLPSSKIGDIIAQNLAKVGIKVVLTPMERGLILQKVYVDNQFDMVVNSYSLGPDPDVGVERFYNSNNIFPIQAVNNGPYINKEVDKLFDEQRVQTDFNKRKAIYDKISEILWNDIPVFPFCAYGLPGVYNGKAASGIYEFCDSPAREDYVFAKPV